MKICLKKQYKNPSAFSGLSRRLLADGQVSVYREEQEGLDTMLLLSGRMMGLSSPPEMKQDGFNRTGTWRADAVLGRAALALG